MGDITQENLPKFKRLYKSAVEEGKTQFTFEGQEVLVAYAKYVIEYLDGRKQ